MPSPGSRGTHQERGRRRRAQLIQGVLHVLLEQGLEAVSARSVAIAAKVPLAAITYYFTSLDELIAEALTALLHRWVEQVRRTTRHVRTHPAQADLARWVTQAMLPPGGRASIQAHYELLLACGRRTALAAALARGRGHLDEALGELIAASMPSSPRRPSPPLVLALLDGAVVSALSEGAPVGATLRARLRELLEHTATA
ncbi:TetR/AcrR family transcriptional regulator [Stigmatella aurantiaca]|uniref:EbrA repressor n=1 Tax=Stigmatella aurantiaca (strain DW4/3-1) TaxID=378806 RepID=Q08WX4_STIAD|nr:TetR family transcriptional regulator [Stigmatella aurantiaca]ADO70878.1 Transcriptional regulator, TetR-like protein [Stigmatella aurantiaca DW4/3-1]EAU64965.1 EbrA repressor [Stigmatella aurantiaca DW4/3-1]